VQEALRAAGIEYEKVIAAHGSPIPFLRKGSREKLREATDVISVGMRKINRADPSDFFLCKEFQ